MAYPDAAFMDSFSELAKLLDNSSDRDHVDPSTVSRASKPAPSPAGVGPQGIFPGVKIADPKGAPPLPGPSPVLQQQGEPYPQAASSHRSAAAHAWRSFCLLGACWRYTMTAAPTQSSAQSKRRRAQHLS